MEPENEEFFIQPQSGLGDLIQALPYIEKLRRQDSVTVATNHAYVLDPFGDDVKTVPVEFNGIIPIRREGYEYLYYSRHGAKRCRESYFVGDDYDEYAAEVQDRFIKFYTNTTPEIDGAFIVFAPPRAAARHKNKNSPFECAPHIERTHAVLSAITKDKKVVLIGKDERFTDFPVIPGAVDLRDKTSFAELCALIIRSRIVVSQISAVTTLAGLLGKLTAFLPAATESQQQHAAHVAGVAWHGQAIV